MKRTATALFLGVLAACPTTSGHRPELELRLAAAPAVPRAGDTLRLTATLANPFDEPIEVEARCTPAVVFSVGPVEGGRVAHRTSESWPCGVAGERYRLAPGDSVTFHDRWLADSDGAFTVNAAIGEHYVVRGERRAFKIGHAFEPVAVRVAPR